MDGTIRAEELTRRFGDVLAVDRVGFEVTPGEVFGFLGPNGAGKTTTVRMLTGVIEPTSGRAYLSGRDVTAAPIRARTGVAVVPEECNVYLDLTVWQNLMLMAELHGVRRRDRVRDGDRLLEEFGLAERRRQKAQTLSKGLRQRLVLCSALVCRPSILFLDEPTSGLDVASARTIRQSVRALRDEGTTVFLTTHNMAEAEDLCDRVAIINRGCIVALDTPDDLRRLISTSRSVDVSFAGERQPETDDLVRLPAATECSRAGEVYRIYTEAPGELATQVVGMAGEQGLAIDSIRTREPDLEDVFLHLTTHDEQAGGAADDVG